MPSSQRRPRSRRRSIAALLAAVALAVGIAAVALAAPIGSVKQVAGKDGCYTADGSSGSGPGTCRNIRGGEGATTLAISPGGRFAYLDGYGQNNDVPVLAVFRRSDDGRLHQLSGKKGCFSSDGSSEEGPHTCTNARDLDSGDATSVVISRDGRFVYVASQLQIMSDDIGGVAIFRRSVKNGTLHQLPGKAGCVSATGESEDGPGTCTRTRETDDTSNVHLTPDQKYLYASNYDEPPHSGIAIFKRGARSGRLHQLKGRNGCITDDGTTAQSGTKVVCAKSPNLGEPWDVATPDNRFAYVPAAYGPDLVQAFERNAKGGLVPLTGKHSCVSDDGTSPAGPLRQRPWNVQRRACGALEEQAVHLHERLPGTLASRGAQPQPQDRGALAAGRQGGLHERGRLQRRRPQHLPGRPRPRRRVCRRPGTERPDSLLRGVQLGRSDGLPNLEEDGGVQPAIRQGRVCERRRLERRRPQHLRQGARDRGGVSGCARRQGSRRLCGGGTGEWRGPPPRFPLAELAPA